MFPNIIFDVILNVETQLLPPHVTHHTTPPPPIMLSGSVVYRQAKTVVQPTDHLV